MSSITIHDVAARARGRIARVAQIEALPPQLARHDGEHWQLNRAAPIRGNYRQQIRPRDIELGEIIAYEIGGAETGVAASDGGTSTATIISRGGGGVSSAPSRTFSFNVRLPAMNAGQVYIITSPPLPWAWHVTNMSWGQGEGTPNANFNILSLVEDYAGVVLEELPSGTAMIENVVDPTYVGGGAGVRPIGPRAKVLNPWGASGGSYGSKSGRSGERCAIALQPPSGILGGDEGTLVLTVEANTAAPAAPRIITTTPAAPRVTPEPTPEGAPPPTIAAPRPAPAPAACAPAYRFLAEGPGYSTQSGPTGVSAWTTWAQEQLATTPAICPGDVSQITDEINRLLRNFGGSLSAIPLQIAPLIDFYRRVLLPPASRGRISGGVRQPSAAPAPRTLNYDALVAYFSDNYWARYGLAPQQYQTDTYARNSITAGRVLPLGF